MLTYPGLYKLVLGKIGIRFALVECSDHSNIFVVSLSLISWNLNICCKLGY